MEISIQGMSFIKIKTFIKDCLLLFLNKVKTKQQQQITSIIVKWKRGRGKELKKNDIHLTTTARPSH